MSPAENRFATVEEGRRFERFLDHLARRGRRPSTLRSYTSDWQALTIWYRRAEGRAFGADALDADLIARWRAAADRGKSPATVLRRMAFARTYGQWLAGEGVMDDTDLEDMRDEARLTQPDQAAGARRDGGASAAVAGGQPGVPARSGDRVPAARHRGAGERLAALDVGDVDFGRGEVWVRGGPDRRVVLPTRAARKLAWSLGERGLLALPAHGEIVLPATGGWPPSARVTPPDPASLPALCAVPLSPMPFGVEGPPGAWPLFVGERGRLSVNGVQRVVRKHAAFARVDATPQVLRHTFAFDLWRRTHDLVALAEALGNEAVESGRVYAQLEAGEVAEGLAEVG
ncbi:MAG: tyrosine-type recombinase/integrase [Myxococcales bacterium]|nr:tyrosine-type recombinase/integrase [Myxococcales bacterium]